MTSEYYMKSTLTVLGRHKYNLHLSRIFGHCMLRSASSNPRTSYHMAIIRSLAIGKGRKSAGNITFRTVRGRTVVSEKVGERPITRVDGALSVYEARFKLISMYIGLHRADINASFDKTKYGSQGNYFYKVNKAGMEAAIESLVSNAQNATPAEVETAVTTYATANPTSIYRVKKTGYTSKFLSAAWKSSDNPTPIVPPTGVTINGAVGRKGASFVASTPELAPVDATTSITITDSAASFNGIAASAITAFDSTGAEQSDTVTISAVVASGNTLAFDCEVGAALDGGKAIFAFRINSKYYQLSGQQSGGNDNSGSGDGDQGDNPLG